MVIAIFTDTYPPQINGVATSTYNLVRAFKNNGHRVIVVTTRFDKGKLSIKDDVIRIPGIVLKKFYGLTITGFYNRHVIKYLKDAGAELIHYHSDASMGVFARRASKILNIPVVYTYHTMYEEYTHYFSKGKFFDSTMKKLVRNYSRSVSKHLNTIITPTEKSKEYLLKAGVKQNIFVIPTGMNVDRFYIYKDTQKFMTSFKNRHNYKTNTKTILSLSRLGKEKSIDVTIKYFASYIQSHPRDDVRLIIAGEGPDKKEFVNLVNELHINKKVIFVGKIPNKKVVNYYLISDCFVSSSLTETQGLTLLEAMASRIPVLARKDKTTLLLINDCKNGFIFENLEEFNEKLELILTMNIKQKNELKSNIESSLKKYSLETFYEKILEAYNYAIENHNKNN